MKALAAFAWLVVASTAQAAVEVPPRPDRYATDRAGVVGAARLAALNERLAQFERDTSNQVLVVVDRRLPADTTLEEYATAAFQAWAVGQKGKDNGAVFFVFVDDRKMRIEVGYGLEGALPDIRAASIVEDHAKPRFREQDYAGGVEAAADQILRAARGEAYQGSGRTYAEGGGSLDGPPPFWMWLMPLFALALGALAAHTNDTGSKRWVRGAVTAGIVTLVGSMLGTVVSKDGRMITIGLGCLLLGGVPGLWFGVRQQADARLSGRRAFGRQILTIAGCVIFASFGLLCFLGIWGARFGVGGWVLLAALLALPVGGLLYASDPLMVVTYTANRLAGLAFFTTLLFTPFYLFFGAADQLPDLLDWMVPAGLVLLVTVVVARSRGWVLWPKTSGRGGSYSGSGYSSGSSWSSGSSGGSSYSGGGGRSGGGGASGSW